MSKTPKRLTSASSAMTRPQFSIRTLLLITALLAITIGWLADRQCLKNQLHEAANQDIRRRQEIWRMQQSIQLLEANATIPDETWRFQDGTINR
jgi:hypothetical protein